MENLSNLSGQTALAIAGLGFLLGWSVAWPPGPVNMEIVRRGTLNGFWSGYSICLGGITGDALWAILIFGGTAAATAVLLKSSVLTFVSLSLLVALALHYLWTAKSDYTSWTQGQRTVSPKAFDSSKNGFCLGLVLTLTSPWSIAFWLGVSGLIDRSGINFGVVAVLIASIVLGAATWGLILSLVLQPLRPFLQQTFWHAVAKLITGVFLLGLGVWKLAFVGI